MSSKQRACGRVRVRVKAGLGGRQVGDASALKEGQALGGTGQHVAPWDGSVPLGRSAQEVGEGSSLSVATHSDKGHRDIGWVGVFCGRTGLSMVRCLLRADRVALQVVDALLHPCAPAVELELREAKPLGEVGVLLTPVVRG